MQCQQCGRPLANANAICTACDLELSTSSHLDVGAHTGKGRYRCPACSGSFGSWTTTVSPRNARWYTPQLHVPACPLCTEALRWKRDAEPAQLPAGLRGIAMGMTWGVAYSIPTQLRQWATEQLGKWFLLLIPLLLILMFFVAARPSLQGTGSGPGRFVLPQPPDNQLNFLAPLLSGPAILASFWVVPQTAQLPLWCAWLALAGAGCLTAVLWRRSTEQRKHMQTPGSAAPSPTRPS